ncbi:hypothetical protein [Malikia granosa]|uniref:Uncharacterized protein n=1 Tax=Malikia granosa TaxID=263067 RepID=A0A2S9K123_9BURK|nr:hypothetical protein [Malikia granosa]PRD64150.1 hypothetical protein C6P64_15925 [Malikia granosa]
MNRLLYQLDDDVVITASGERGQVIGRAEYTNSSNNYLVRYKCADGRAVEQWWQEDALELWRPKDALEGRA